MLILARFCSCERRVIFGLVERILLLEQIPVIINDLQRMKYKHASKGDIGSQGTQVAVYYLDALMKNTKKLTNSKGFGLRCTPNHSCSNPLVHDLTLKLCRVYHPGPR